MQMCGNVIKGSDIDEWGCGVENDVCISAMHGLGFGSKPGLQAGPGFYQILRAGPGLAWAEKILNTLGLGRAWAGPGPNKNTNTKPRFFILILIKTDYKLYFRLMNV